MQAVSTLRAHTSLAGVDHASSRWVVFVHQDGLVLSATVRALEHVGILQPSLVAERTVAELYPEITRSGFGYLRVGLRCLASQGWLDTEPTLNPETTVMRWSPSGRSIAPHLNLYERAGAFLAGFTSSAPDAWARPWSRRQIGTFVELLALARDRWRLDPELPPLLRALTTTHLDAALHVPTMLWLRGTGRITADRPVLDGPDPLPSMGELLTSLGLLDEGSGRWTELGQRNLAISIHFGMTASYLPMLASLPDLYRGKRVVVRSAASAQEWHVHRGLNVDASAAAHRRYFADADGVFVELFNRSPVESQPRFIADMGCGDGTWLVHLHRLIAAQTLRGQHAEEHPLLLVGVDYNETALNRARLIAEQASVPAMFAVGDVGNPEQLRLVLSEHGLRITDGLHIRSFVDHDRSYAGSDPLIDVPGWSSGAYVDARGRPLAGEDVERDLVAHLTRWAPHIGKHGLVMLEAHCIAPRVARKHVGAIHSVAFDSYHGYSHQYPVDHAAFVRCCREAGLQPASIHERRYPSTRPLVAVSLNRFTTRSEANALPALNGAIERTDTWRPDQKIALEDGEALHRLLFNGGDLRHPRLWCSAPTGIVVAGALEAIEQRLAEIEEGETIRVLDYGAGTGLASIELLKALHERGIEHRLQQIGAAFELHLVDLPSSWFAQGFALLRDCQWTQFHALRNDGGGFRPLLDVTGGRTMDVVIANMVFHLIPQRALRRTAADLASVLRPDGRLVWSSPDLGPPGEYAVLFHDPNRALRQRWVGLLTGDQKTGTTLRAAVTHARGSVSESRLRAAQKRAARRILPSAHRAADVAAALEEYMTGGLAFPTFELLNADVIDTLLVPANQREYLPEISDAALREDAIRELMLDQILPEFADGPAATAAGLNIQWTLGEHTRSAG